MVDPDIVIDPDPDDPMDIHEEDPPVIDVDVEEPITDMDVIDPSEEDVEEDTSCPYFPLACVTGDLRAIVEAIDIASAPFKAPDSSRRVQWDSLIGYILDENWANTFVRASSMTVHVTALHDTVSGRDYILVHDPENGEGVYAFNLSPSRDLMIEVPYPVEDAGTLAQGIEALRGTGGESGWALLIGGTARCASSSTLPCDGTTVACTGTADDFRQSDVAHNPNLIFHTVHVQLIEHAPTPAGGMPFAVQLQDQSDASGAYVYISDGTTTDGTSVPLGISIELRNALRSRFPAWSSHIMSCNDAVNRAHVGFDSECQTTNVQGRWANGSSSPCTMAALVSSDRFVVVEQAVDMRDPTHLGDFVLAIYDLP